MRPPAMAISREIDTEERIDLTYRGRPAVPADPGVRSHARSSGIESNAACI